MQRLLAGLAAGLLATGLLAAPVAAQSFQPGQWRTTVRLLSAAMPGVPPAQIEAMIAKPRIITACMSAEEAKAGPRMLMQGRSDCTLANYRMAGGLLAGDVRCPAPGGATIVALRGRYTATRYSLRAEASGPGGMRMRNDITGQRLGACPDR